MLLLQVVHHVRPEGIYIFRCHFVVGARSFRS
jgi:hypothetical protein